ncbi:hypothetical protein KsCSTR_10110 [Candidatus Kuenenia stuttgartiensis]|uniref:Uncharacterized protein n=1 Tax=Kuenenia stuttgartiensis TaxID=174633 RepID=Q1PYT7_KUEST|nr:hypothetical protein KsCSTR_10110 [Candidatus Kuenenia stuttgartiensis]CAJ72248.1 unknown protein [Candidatus Kuenenia stuttgartiensis]
MTSREPSAILEIAKIPVLHRNYIFRRCLCLHHFTAVSLLFNILCHYKYLFSLKNG